MLDTVFLKAQGYRILDNVLFQDNRSSIILEKNGKDLSSKRTKHIKIRYLFITDMVAQGDVSLVWCCTCLCSALLGFRLVKNYKDFV